MCTLESCMVSHPSPGAHVGFWATRVSHLMHLKNDVRPNSERIRFNCHKFDKILPHNLEAVESV